MIKNLLYSLFLHFLLLLIIYLNFNLRKLDEDKSNEITVSLVAMQGDENSNLLKPQVSKSEEAVKSDENKQAEEKTEAKSPIKSEQNKVRKKPKKLMHAKPAKALKKQTAPEPVQEFKPQEKEEIKQDDAKQSEDDKTQNEHEDKEQNQRIKNEENLGAKNESPQELENKQKQAAKADNSADMANSLENIDLSPREKFNIQTQLNFCYHMATSGDKEGGAKSRTALKVQISREGYIDAESGDKIEINEKVKRALELCSPLRNLPQEKYDIWKEVVLEFE